MRLWLIIILLFLILFWYILSEIYFQNFPLLLCFLLTCLVFFIFFDVALSFFILLSTCFTLRLSFPPIDLLFLLTTYFLLSFNSLLDLSYNLPICLSLLTSLIPYWLITFSAFFCVLFNFFCILIFLRTFAYNIFFGTLALIACNLYFSLRYYYLVIGGCL